MSWVKVDGILLKSSAVVVTGVSDDDEPSFGEVSQLYLKENKVVLLELKLFDTVEYASHFNSWKVKRTSTYSIVPYSSLTSNQVLMARSANLLFFYVTLKNAL